MDKEIYPDEACFFHRLSLPAPFRKAAARLYRQKRWTRPAGDCESPKLRQLAVYNEASKANGGMGYVTQLSDGSCIMVDGVFHRSTYNYWDSLEIDFC